MAEAGTPRPRRAGEGLWRHDRRAKTWFRIGCLSREPELHLLVQTPVATPLQYSLGRSSGPQELAHHHTEPVLTRLLRETPAAQRDRESARKQTNQSQLEYPQDAARTHRDRRAGRCARTTNGNARCHLSHLLAASLCTQ